MIPEATSFCAVAAMLIGHLPENIHWHRMGAHLVVDRDAALAGAMGHDDAVTVLAYCWALCEHIALERDEDALELARPSWMALVDVCPSLALHWPLVSA